MERQYNPTLDEYSRVEPLGLSSRTSLSYEEDRVTPDTANVHLASLDEKKRLWWRNATINTLFIASWFFFATILSVYNKWMFSPSHFGFPSPLFVTTGHMFVQFILAMILRTLWPRKFRPEHNPQPKDYSLKVVPTAIATSLDIGLSNLSLKTITLSFYTMCKSSSLIFVLLFAFLFRLETFSWRLIGVIFLIFSGVLLMVATETHFILEGFLLVLSASGLGGLRWSLTQLLLKNKKVGLDNPAATVYWLSPIMGVTLAIISVLLGEWSKLFGTEFFRGSAQTIKTVLFLTAPGAIAFCMVLSEFYIIQRTGVVPMSIAGIAKEVTTITISAWFFNDQLTPLNITGVMITICGICLFTFHKYRKSIKSTVPLDAHGNPIQAEDEWLDGIDGLDGYDRGETTRLTSVPHVRDSEQDDSSTNDRSRLLFSANDDEDDDVEGRRVRSDHSPGTTEWEAENRPLGHAARITLEEASGAVARESIELSRVWTRDSR